MPFIACLLLLSYGLINIVALLYYGVCIDSIIGEEDSPIYSTVPLLYKEIWGGLRDNLNIIGSIIVEILLHILTLPALIVITLIIYLIIIPSIYIIKFFLYIFRNKNDKSNKSNKGPGIE